MNIVLKFLLDAVWKYLQAHPDQLDKLAAALVEHLIAALPEAK